MPRLRAERLLRTMIAAVHHNIAWEVGTWCDESMGVYVGWVARKKSFASGMPLRNERGDVVLIFSGEEFPGREQLSQLREHGHAVQAAEAAYLPHLYEDDPNFLAKLNGRFHGLLYDRNRERAVLFNDRYGMHRLYYHEGEEAFFFAAEAKAILAVKRELRSIDPQAFGELVACGCVLNNRTLFAGISALPQASAWEFHDGAVHRKGSYFDSSEWEQQETSAPEPYYADLRASFTRNLPRYFDSTAPVAVSLTGGLDTRMIMAWHKADSSSLPCYSFGGPFRDSRDVAVARQVARLCGQRHDVIRVGDEFLSRFSHYAERAIYLTDGCVGVNHAADLYLNELAAQIAPVRMTGNYGGEVLRRVRAFKPVQPIVGLFSGELAPYLEMARHTYADVIKVHPLSFAVFRQAPWHHHGLLALEQTQLSLRTPYLDNDLVRTVFRAPESALANQDISLRLIADGSSALGQIPTDLGIGGKSSPFAVARQCLLQFSFKAEYAYDVGMPQWLARIDHFLSPLRPERIFLGWHKFAHFRVWYRGVLAPYVREILLDPSSLSRPYITRKVMERLVSSHLRGDRNYTGAIHKLLSLELIHRLFVDSALNPDARAIQSPVFLEQRI